MDTGLRNHMPNNFSVESLHTMVKLAHEAIQNLRVIGNIMKDHDKNAPVYRLYARLCRIQEVIDSSILTPILNQTPERKQLGKELEQQLTGKTAEETFALRCNLGMLVKEGQRLHDEALGIILQNSTVEINNKEE